MKAQTHRVRESAIVMDLSDLEQEASQLVTSAKAEAARIIAEAKATAARELPLVREEARRLGHAEGMAAGMAEGQASGHAESAAAYAKALLDLTTRWSQTLDLLHQNMPAHAADAKTDLLRLAMAIAERITHRQAAMDRTVVQSTVAETLKMVGAARMVVLMVHPTEMDMLENFLPDLLAKIRSIESAQLTPDETITPGGCEVRFGAGKVDARLETQIQRIAEELLPSD